MGIKSSYETASTYAEGFVADIGLALHSVENVFVQEYNFLEGRGIFSDIKSIINEYSDIVDRDSQNIKEIAWEFEVLDSDISEGF